MNKGLYEKYIKRILDVVLSLLGIIFLFPIYLITAILIRKNLGSPIIFKQNRPGLNEEIFSMYKFRSMTNEKDKEGNLLPNEQRHTSFGQKIRSTSLDELPELFNVLKGDMSLVGPRPLRVMYLDRYNKEQKRRHEIRPGITGLAQINGRNSITWEKRFEYDIDYVDNITFVNDLKILLKTVLMVVKRDGINMDGDTTMSEFMGTKDKSE